jgi:hypothetical protein
MKRLLTKLITLLFPPKIGEFPATPKGFNDAKKWAQSQPHTYSENLTLWEELYDRNTDGWWTLAQINEQKRIADNYKEVKSSRKPTQKILQK